MTQGDLADKLGISRATVASWETGRREPDMDTFVKLGKIFNVTVDYITGKVSDELSKEELYRRAELFFMSSNIQQSDKDKIVQDIMELYFKKKNG